MFLSCLFCAVMFVSFSHPARVAGPGAELGSLNTSFCASTRVILFTLFLHVFLHVFVFIVFLLHLFYVFFVCIVCAFPRLGVIFVCIFWCFPDVNMVCLHFCCIPKPK